MSYLPIQMVSFSRPKTVCCEVSMLLPAVPSRVLSIRIKIVYGEKGEKEEGRKKERKAEGREGFTVLYGDNL